MIILQALPGSTLMWGVFIVLTILSLIASQSVKSKFKRYAKIPTQGNLTGREVAQMMLADHNIRDVRINVVNGTLTDHYNPTNRTLNLSPDVYNGTSVAAADVAAHECGHAIQHADRYAWLGLRSALVPIVSFANQWVSLVLLAGLILIKTFPNLMLIAIILFAITTLFSFVTLPVEINASRRALQWMEHRRIATPDTQQYAVSALRSAAYTYIVAALTSLATLLYYVTIYMNRR
ncbi:MAG: zinc metallopeptidase [Bacteroidales bacterium]|nr:zinc metallopeptidase [Bacteroidales bacterium]